MEGGKLGGLAIFSLENRVFLRKCSGLKGGLFFIVIKKILFQRLEVKDFHLLYFSFAVRVILFD